MEDLLRRIVEGMNDEIGSLRREKGSAEDGRLSLGFSEEKEKVGGFATQVLYSATLFYNSKQVQVELWKVYSYDKDRLIGQFGNMMFQTLTNPYHLDMILNGVKVQ